MITIRNYKITHNISYTDPNNKNLKKGKKIRKLSRQKIATTIIIHIQYPAHHKRKLNRILLIAIVNVQLIREKKIKLSHKRINTTLPRNLPNSTKNIKTREKKFVEKGN